MPPCLSVIICSHDPRVDYLQRALDALRVQTLPLDRWELLLVDNASEQPLCARFDLSWHPRARHILEAELGLTPARLRGIAEAAYDLLVFVDDDNLLSTNYLEVAESLSCSWPMLGAWGAGCLRPEFDEPPPLWTKPYWPLMGIDSLSRDRWSNCWDGTTTPCGAGLCLRRSIALKYTSDLAKEPVRRSLDRRGKSLISGGDTDIALTTCDYGLGTAMFRCLEVTHLIPPWRLREDYLVRMKESMAYSQVILDVCRDKGSLAVSWGRTALNYVRAWLKPRRDRKFRLAALRGQALARRDLRRSRATAATKNRSSAS
jgi:glycosyltransferase involved in cell wall biosynthesis